MSHHKHRKKNKQIVKCGNSNAGFKKVSQMPKYNNLSPVKQNIGYEIIKMGMRLLKETEGDIPHDEAVSKLLEAFPSKTPEALKAEIGKLKQNYNHIVGNKRSKDGIVSQIIGQLKAGREATAGVSSTTNRYSSRAWHAFHEV